MPSMTKKQHLLMEAVAHGWHKPGGGPSRSVAEEFVAADKAAGKFQKRKRKRGVTGEAAAHSLGRR